MSQDTQKIQEAKRVIAAFLKIVGITLEKEFIKNLPEPELKEDDVLGKVIKFRIFDDNVHMITSFEVSEEPLRVTRFSQNKTSTEAKYSEKDAEGKAKGIVPKLVPRFQERNFVLSKNHGDDDFRFEWYEEIENIEQIRPLINSSIKNEDKLLPVTDVVRGYLRYLYIVQKQYEIVL